MKNDTMPAEVCNPGVTRPGFELDSNPPHQDSWSGGGGSGANARATYSMGQLDIFDSVLEVNACMAWGGSRLENEA